MASQAQINANRANAKCSTGPRTAEGKANSSSNSRRHGLLSTTPVFSNEQEQNDYLALTNKLRKECLPDSELELQAFERYAFNTYQVMRAQRMEADTQESYLNNPDDTAAFLKLERMTKLTAMLERRADKALTELRKLQRDRISAIEIKNELYLLEKKIPIPASLPVADMRRSNLRQTSPLDIAVMLLGTTPELKAIFDNQTNPIEKNTPRNG